MAKVKQKRPTRDEFELEELGEKLVDVMEEGSSMAFKVWGTEELVHGRITVMDSKTKLVHIQAHGEINKVPFLDIMKVENSRE